MELEFFNQARDLFRDKKDNAAASIYLATAMDAESAGAIDDDTFLNALCEIRDYLAGLGTG